MSKKAQREKWIKDQLSRTCPAGNAKIWFPLTDTSDDADLLESCKPNAIPDWQWNEWIAMREN